MSATPTVLLLLLASVAAVFGADEAPAMGQADGMTQMNCGARIACVTPDGQTNPVSKLPTIDPGAAALIMEDDTVSCVLQEGETNFVVELPKKQLLDRLTFLNENALARGELKISVANDRLRPDSNEWQQVDGVIPFSRKRLFGVSLIGIEARFVRLSFRVEKGGRIAAYAREAAAKSASRSDLSIKDAFATPALDSALDAPMAIQQTREGVLLRPTSESVGPLFIATR